MKKIQFLAVMVVAANLNAAGLSAVAGWPRFRGPNGNGIAMDANVPTTWSETKNLQWKTGLPGRGSSSPIVCGERVFVTSYSGYGEGNTEGSLEKLQRHLVCLERETGKILWDQTVAAELPEDRYTGYLTEHGYASSTPVTDGQRVYVFFGKTGVLAFDFTGKQLWKVNVGKQSSNRRWGSGASLLLYKNLVIVNAAEESRSIRALDTLTGKEVWKAESESLELCFSTPLLVDCGSGRTDLVVAVPGELWALNPDTGKLRWFAQTNIRGNVSPSVVTGDGVIFVTGGYPDVGTAAVRGGGKGDVTKTHVLWSSEVASYVPSPVVLGGYLYFVSDKGVAICMETKTGIPVFKEPLPGITSAARGSKPVYASTILANGHLYAVTRKKGTFVLKAARYFAVVAQNNFTGDDSEFNATPAISGNQIFLRSNRYLYCVKTDAGG